MIPVWQLVVVGILTLALIAALVIFIGVIFLMFPKDVRTGKRWFWGRPGDK